MAAADSKPLVEVVCALPEEQPIVSIDFVAGMTAAEAVRQSGLERRFAEQLKDGYLLGVWNVQVEPEFALRPGDRVEISRALSADPRAMRHELMNDGRVMGGAGVRK